MDNRIVVYSSPSCQKCTMLKEWLRSRGYPFEEKDLENVDVKTDLVMKNMVVLSAPALEVKGIVYRQDQIFNPTGELNGDLTKILGIEKSILNQQEARSVFARVEQLKQELLKVREPFAVRMHACNNSSERILLASVEEELNTMLVGADNILHQLNQLGIFHGWVKKEPSPPECRIHDRRCEECEES